VLAVVIVVILAAATAYYLSQPGPGPGPTGTACSGTKAYSGTVSNDTGAGVASVVVKLAATPPNVGTNATVTTASNGAWSATLSGVCAYDARFYWQSASVGPRLASASGLGASSTQAVHVSWQTADLNLLNEFPHDSNASVSITIPDGLSFFVDANASGSIATGFLPTDEAGNAGYNFTVSGGVTANGTSPFVLLYHNATVYRVQDANGNFVVYATPSPTGTFGTASAVDPLNMTTAISNLQAQAIVPYVQVAGRSTSTTTVNVTNETHELLGDIGTFFGSSLQDFVTVRTNTTLFLRMDLTITNALNRSQCYVVDLEGPVAHAWFYGVGNCP